MLCNLTSTDSGEQDISGGHYLPTTVLVLMVCVSPHLLGTYTTNLTVASLCDHLGFWDFPAHSSNTLIHACTRAHTPSTPAFWDGPELESKFYEDNLGLYF